MRVSVTRVVSVMARIDESVDSGAFVYRTIHTMKTQIRDLNGNAAIVDHRRVNRHDQAHSLRGECVKGDRPTALSQHAPNPAGVRQCENGFFTLHNFQCE